MNATLEQPQEIQVYDQLQRLQGTVDKIATKLDSLVRLEERQIILAEKAQVLDSKLTKIDTRVARIENVQSGSNTSLGILERAAWLAATTLIGFFIYLVEKA